MVRQALEEVVKAVGGGYCRLQMPLKLALGVRGTVAGHRLGALEGGAGGGLPAFQCIPAPPSASMAPPPPRASVTGARLGVRGWVWSGRTLWNTGQPKHTICAVLEGGDRVRTCAPFEEGILCVRMGGLARGHGVGLSAFGGASALACARRCVHLQDNFPDRGGGCSPVGVGGNCGGGGGAADATVTMSPFWDAPPAGIMIPLVCVCVGGVGMSPWCVVLVCSWQRLLAGRHSLPVAWTLSLHKWWCPLASQGGGRVKGWA